MSATELQEELVCQDFVELVTDYLEGALPADVLAECEKHLEDCPYCKFYLEQMRKTIELLGSAARDALPDEMRAHLVEAFRVQVAASRGAVSPPPPPHRSRWGRLVFWRRKAR